MTDDADAPVSIIAVADEPQALLSSSEGEWAHLEFEVALDLGFVVHVCADIDASGYITEELPGSKRGQSFLMGDGGTIPIHGHWLARETGT